MVHLEKCTGGGSDDCSKVHTIEQTNSNCAKQQLEREEGQQGIDGQGSFKVFFLQINEHCLTPKTPLLSFLVEC